MKFLKGIIISILSDDCFSISEISRKLNTSEGMIVDSLKLLEQKGFVKKMGGKSALRPKKCFHCSMGDSCGSGSENKASFYEVTIKGRNYANT
jgi:hypothetical protein